MTRLFPYAIPIHAGAAPNPFHGTCSLAICNPTISRASVHRLGDSIYDDTANEHAPLEQRPGVHAPENETDDGLLRCQLPERPMGASQKRQVGGFMTGQNVEQKAV